jgi:cell division protein FtsB
MRPPYTTTSKAKMIGLLVMRLKNLNWQMGRINLQNAPQAQELANLQQAVVDATAELAATNAGGNG